MSELQQNRRRGNAVEDLGPAPKVTHSHPEAAEPDAAAAEAGARQLRSANFFAVVDREVAYQDKVLRELIRAERERHQVLRNRARVWRREHEAIWAQSEMLRAQSEILRAQSEMLRDQVHAQWQHRRSLIQLFPEEQLPASAVTEAWRAWSGWCPRDGAPSRRRRPTSSGVGKLA